MKPLRLQNVERDGKSERVKKGKGKERRRRGYRGSVGLELCKRVTDKQGRPAAEASKSKEEDQRARWAEVEPRPERGGRTRRLRHRCGGI